MNKIDFLSILKEKLGHLPYHEVERLITFYSEVIDDKMEDGMDEVEAIASIGSIEDILRTIEHDDIPNSNNTNNFDYSNDDYNETTNNETTTSSKSNRILLIILLIVTFPLWIGLLLGVLGTLFGITVALYAIVFSMLVTFFAFLFAAIIMIGFGVYYIPSQIEVSILLFGGSFMTIGLSLLTYPYLMMATKYMWKLPAKLLDFCKDKYKVIKEKL